MTIFIVTYHKDFEWLDYLMRAIGKYARGFDGVVLVSDDDGHKIPDHTVSHVRQMPVDVVYVQRPTTKPASMEHTMVGYYWQQWLKLNWWRYCDADRVVQIDSDCMATKPFSPAGLLDAAGRPMWHLRPWANMNNQYWRASTEKLLRLGNTPFQGMMGQTYVFTRAATLSFLSYLTQRPSAEWSWQWLVETDVEMMSEYCLFGSFLYHIADNGYTLRIWKDAEMFMEHHNHALGTYKDRSWDGFTPEIRERRAEALGGFLVNGCASA